MPSGEHLPTGSRVSEPSIEATGDLDVRALDTHLVLVPLLAPFPRDEPDLHPGFQPDLDRVGVVGVGRITYKDEAVAVAEVLAYGFLSSLEADASDLEADIEARDVSRAVGRRSASDFAAVVAPL